MIKILFTGLFIISLGFLVWLYHNSGLVIIQFMDYQYEMNFIVAILISVIFVFSLLMIVKIVLTLNFVSDNVKKYYKSLTSVDFLKENTKLWQYIYQGKVNQAGNKVKILKNCGLVTETVSYINADISFIDKESTVTKEALLDLLKTSGDNVKTLKMLKYIYIAENDLEHAIQYGLRLWNLQPQAVLFDILTNLFIRAKKWQHGWDFIKHNTKWYNVTKEKKLLHDIFIYMHANHYFMHNDLLSVKNLLAKLYDKKVLEVYLLQAKFALRTKDASSSFRYLAKAWQLYPCILIIDLFILLTTLVSQHQVTKLAKKNISSNKKSEYDDMLLMVAEIATKHHKGICSILSIDKISWSTTSIHKSVIDCFFLLDRSNDLTMIKLVESGFIKNANVTLVWHLNRLEKMLIEYSTPQPELLYLAML